MTPSAISPASSIAFGPEAAISTGMCRPDAYARRPDVVPKSIASPARSTRSAVMHARLAPPRLDEGALVRLTQREGAEDREAAGKVPHGLEGHLGGVGVPARRMDHGG